MRADRLISLLMLLQTRGRMTAAELGVELEVSERTIYRDLEALSLSGVPVYAERGPGGGCALLDSYRSNLTGLTQTEVRALLMLSIPSPLADLGLGRELKAALLKLSAAHRTSQEPIQQRLYLDWSPWFQSREPVPHLQAIYQAVWQDQKICLVYQTERGGRVERAVDPYGLVAKGGVWYLVAAREGQPRAYPLSAIAEIRPLAESFARPAGFDLEAFWRDWCGGVEANRPAYPVTARVAPGLLPYLAYSLGPGIRGQIETGVGIDAEGWQTLVLPFETFEAARERILGFGRAVEVLEPLPLRLSVIDFARGIGEFYAQRDQIGP